MFRKLFNWFRKPKTSSQDMSIMVEEVLHKLTQTDEHEITCDEVHELIDQFSEMEIAGEDVQHLMPLMQKHLDLCADCEEEHIALVQALNFEKTIEDQL